MTEKIPPFVHQIMQKFQDSGYEIYLVGGCVRDLLLSKNVKDWDLTTSATPDQIQKLFPHTFYDNAFGTVGIVVNKDTEAQQAMPAGRQVVEVTTYRTEQGYSNKRHPDEVVWGKSLQEDLERRDFTINAMALGLTKSGENKQSGRHEGRDPNPTSPMASRDKQRLVAGLPTVAPVNTGAKVGGNSGQDPRTSFEIVDPFNGQKDLEKQLIRAVGDPEKRFKEDALRLMRAIRFATQLSFSIEDQTLNAIEKDSSLLEHISKERIRDELVKILASPYPYEGIMLLKNSNLLTYILPELLEGIDVSQERPGRHHTTDVFTHNVLSLKYCPSENPIVRFAALIHDIGKPRVQSTDEEGYVIFHNHEIVGAKIAHEICDRLRFSKKEKEKVVTLVRWHMFSVDEHVTESAVRRFIRRVGVENVKDMMDVRIGDRLGSGTETAESWRLKLFKKRIEEQLQPAPFSINDLVIDGNDIMQELQIKPGKKIGELLEKLFEEVDEDLSKNTRDFLITRVRELENSVS